MLSHVHLTVTRSSNRQAVGVGQPKKNGLCLPSEDFIACETYQIAPHFKALVLLKQYLPTTSPIAQEKTIW